MKRKQYSCVLFGVLAVAAVVGSVQRGRASSVLAPATPAPADTPVEVRIDNFSFSPQTLTVAPGTTVKWTNRDDIPHTVVSDDKVTFKSKVLDTDESYSFTFTKAGTFDYFCSVHPKMTAKVIVK